MRPAPSTALGSKEIQNLGTSLVAQWLRLCAPNAGGPGSIPGQGTRCHTSQLKMSHAATKTQRGQTNNHHTESWPRLGQARWKLHFSVGLRGSCPLESFRAGLQRPAGGQGSDALGLNPGSALPSWGSSGTFLPSSGPHFPPLSRDSPMAFASRGHNARHTGWASQVASDYPSPGCLLLP